MARQCEVCSKNDQKYKCPVCLIKYCSVACFKNHKEIGCTSVKPEPSRGEDKKNIVGTDGIDRCESKDTEPNEKKEDFDTQDKVPLELLQLLGKSENVVSLLHNPHLRAMMLQIDSDKSYETLQKAMQEPIFLEFAQACLHIVEPPEGSEKKPAVKIVENIVGVSNTDEKKEMVNEQGLENNKTDVLNSDEKNELVNKQDVEINIE